MDYSMVYFESDTLVNVFNNLANPNTWVFWPLPLALALACMFTLLYGVWAEWPKIAMISIQGYGPEVSPSLDWAFGPEYQINQIDEDLSEWAWNTMTKDVMAEEEGATNLSDLFLPLRLGKLEFQPIDQRWRSRTWSIQMRIYVPASSHLFNHQAQALELDESVDTVSESAKKIEAMKIASSWVKRVQALDTVQAKTETTAPTLKKFVDSLLALADEDLKAMVEALDHQKKFEIFGSPKFWPRHVGNMRARLEKKAMRLAA